MGKLAINMKDSIKVITAAACLLVAMFVLSGPALAQESNDYYIETSRLILAIADANFEVPEMNDEEQELLDELIAAINRGDGLESAAGDLAVLAINNDKAPLPCCIHAMRVGYGSLANNLRFFADKVRFFSQAGDEIKEYQEELDGLIERSKEGRLTVTTMSWDLSHTFGAIPGGLSAISIMDTGQLEGEKLRAGALLSRSKELLDNAIVQFRGATRRQSAMIKDMVDTWSKIKSTVETLSQ